MNSMSNSVHKVGHTCLPNIQSYNTNSIHLIFHILMHIPHHSVCHTCLPRDPRYTLSNIHSLLHMKLMSILDHTFGHTYLPNILPHTLNNIRYTGCRCLCIQLGIAFDTNHPNIHLYTLCNIRCSGHRSLCTQLGIDVHKTVPIICLYTLYNIRCTGNTSFCTQLGIYVHKNYPRTCLYTACNNHHIVDIDWNIRCCSRLSSLFPKCQGGKLYIHHLADCMTSDRLCYTSGHKVLPNVQHGMKNTVLLYDRRCRWHILGCICMYNIDSRSQVYTRSRHKCDVDIEDTCPHSSHNTDNPARKKLEQRLC